jgi:tetratricopeptide (TPR) repeat protein
VPPVRRARAYRSLLRSCLLGVALLAAGAARAAQDDPRLPALLDRLAAAEDLAAARELEGEIWELWTATDDATAAALMAEGQRQLAARAWPSALQTFARLVTLKPDFAEAWNKRATVHYLMGDYRASVLDIQRTLALEPRHFGALSGLGLILMATEQPEAALRAFEAALAIHPYLPGGRTHVEALRQQLQGEPL